MYCQTVLAPGMLIVWNEVMLLRAGAGSLTPAQSPAQALGPSSAQLHP